MNDKTVPSFIRLKHPDTGEICIYPGNMKQKHLDSAVKYEAKTGDIFICSPAKCGTTWLQTTVWLIVHKGQMFSGFIGNHMPMLEFDGSEAAEKIDSSVFPRIIKTHFKQSWVPQHPQAKYLYITRNPKDAMVSYYYHCKGFTERLDCEDLNFDKLFDLYVKNDVVFWGYFGHVSDWYIKRDEPNVLFLLYEDMKVDPEGQILKIARFLGDQYYQDMMKDDKRLLREVMDKSSFSSMKTSISMRGRPDHLPFIRKGVVGDWKNHMSPEQSEIMEDMIRKIGGPSGWDRLWDNHEGVWERQQARSGLAVHLAHCS